MLDTGKCITIIYLPQYYKEKGVVFCKDYAVGIDMKDKKYRYTPTINDIKKAEDIFNKEYNSLSKTGVDVKDYFNCWVRHYVGLMDSSGRKNIIIQLINNKKRSKIKRLLGKGWETTFAVMLADSFYEISTIVSVSIDTGEATYEL